MNYDNFFINSFNKQNVYASKKIEIRGFHFYIAFMKMKLRIIFDMVLESPP